MDRENIFIIGGGSIGLALAVLLRREKRNITLVRGRSTKREAEKKVIRMKMGDESMEEVIEITNLEDLKDPIGIFVIATKAYANIDLARRLRSKSIQGSLVIMQNGLGVEIPFEDLDITHLYRCVLFATSQIEEDGRVLYRPVAPSPIGVVRGDDSESVDIVAQLNSPNFRFTKASNIEELVWEKAIANCVFNSICPLLEIDNGIFHRDPIIFDLAKEVISECRFLAMELGVNLTQEKLEQRLLDISQASDGQLISTLQDINQGRMTEIESLNLEVARLARDIGKSNRVCKTALLGELILGKARLAMNSKSNKHVG